MELGDRQPVEIHRDRRQTDGVVLAGDGEADELEELVVVRNAEAARLAHLTGDHPADRQDAGEILLDLADAAAEEVERGVDEARGAALVVGIDEAGQPRLARGSGAPRQDHRVTALEMTALAFETDPPFVVDRPADGIGKPAGLPGRVGRCRHPHRLDLNHPAGPEPRQNGVDPAGDLVALEIGRALAVGAGEIPAGHHRAVLEQDDAVLDQRRIGHQIGEGRAGMAEGAERDHAGPHARRQGVEVGR